MTGTFGFGSIGVWLERRRALKELQRLTATEVEEIAMRDNNPLSRAQTSLEMGDLKTARESFALAREQMPQHVLTSPVSVEIMLRLGEYDGVESFVLDGAKRFPGKPHYLEGYATVAQRRNNLEEAVRRWAQPQEVSKQQEGLR